MEQVAALGAFFKSLLPGVFGAAVSDFIRLNITKEDATRQQRIFTFIFGVVMAKVFGGAAIEFYKIPFDSWGGVAISVTCAMFGMAVVTQLFIQIPAIIEAARKKITGN